MRCFSDCKVTGSPSSFHSRHVSKTVNIVHLKAWNDSRLSWGDLDSIGIVRVYALLVLSLSQRISVSRPNKLTHGWQAYALVASRLLTKD